MSKLTAAEVRRLAVDSSTDPRTVQVVLEGAPLVTMARQRVASALRAAGYAVPGERAGASDKPEAA
jgi:hypothetical protein